MKRYKLLSGETVGLEELDTRDVAFLENLQRMAKDGISFFEVERVAIGSGSPALQGWSRVTPEIVRSPLYRVASDIATRAGIAEGLILAPEHEQKRSQIPADRSLMSVTPGREHPRHLACRRPQGHPTEATRCAAVRQRHPREPRRGPTLSTGAGSRAPERVRFTPTAGRDAIGNILFGVSARDPFTFAVVIGLVAVVSAADTLVPARRATRVDPLVALRAE